MHSTILQIGDLSQRRLVRTGLRNLGLRVVHDSGAGLMVIEAPEDQKGLAERLPAGARLVTGDVATGADERDMLFARALMRRMSKEYRKLKAAQTPGESPEEQQMFSAPCVEEE